MSGSQRSVRSRAPMTTRRAPAAPWMNAGARPSRRSKVWTFGTDMLRARKGTASPRLYAASSATPWPNAAAVPASVRMAPRTGPIHGVQVIAKAAPKTGELQSVSASRPSTPVATAAEEADAPFQQQQKSHYEDEDPGDMTHGEPVGQ